MEVALLRLRDKYRWPRKKPDIPFNDAGWFPEANKKMLLPFLGDGTKLIVELGSWVGLSTRWMLDRAPNATLIAIDHWRGGPENKDDPLLPFLYETFLSNCWDYRQRLIPLRDDTDRGTNELLELGIKPNLAYIDAGHEFKNVFEDIFRCGKFGCPLVGDDFNPNRWDTVVKAVWEGSIEIRRPFRVWESAWVIDRR